jgi:hypothetical protein
MFWGCGAGDNVLLLALPFTAAVNRAKRDLRRCPLGGIAFLAAQGKPRKAWGSDLPSTSQPKKLLETGWLA